MRPLSQLTFSAYGIHMADQMAIAAVPLIAALIFNATPEIIGALVACQSMAHLLGSLPSGLIVDRTPARLVLLAAAAMSGVGFLIAMIAVKVLSVELFGASILTAGFGVVLFLLASLSLIPIIVPLCAPEKANAKLAMAQAIPAFLAPLFAGYLAEFGYIGILMISCAGFSILALTVSLSLPQFEAPKPQKKNPVRALLQGGNYVVRHSLLLPISLCAIFWNLAFAALLVLLLPLLLNHYDAAPGVFGTALSFFGIGMIAGAWAASHFSGKVPPNLVLLFGPSSSAFAMAGFYFLPISWPIELMYPGFFMLAFGPMMWLVTQNAIRQLVTPQDMLGRVNAVIQTAIYGVRPLGALVGGVLAGAYSEKLALLCVVIAFGLSTGAALFSPLRSLWSLDKLHAV